MDSNKYQHGETSTGDDFGVLQVEKFVAEPYLQNFQFQNISISSCTSKRTKRKTRHDYQDPEQQFFDQYAQINNYRNQNIVGYVTPNQLSAWEAEKQKNQNQNACIQQQRQQFFYGNMQQTMSDNVEPLGQIFVQQREDVVEQGVFKKQQFSIYNAWLKVVQQKLFQRAEQQGYGGLKAVEVSDNFRKFVLQGPQKTQKVMKEAEKNMVEYTQSVVKEYVDMLKQVYGEKMVLDPIVLPASVLSCYNGVQEHKVAEQAEEMASKLHSIRITNKRFIIYQPDVKEGKHWERGLWKIWDAFLEKAGKVSIKQHDKVSSHISSVSFNLNRTTWFDGVGRKVEARHFFAKLDLSSKTDPLIDIDKLLKQKEQQPSKYRTVQVKVKGQSSPQKSTKNVPLSSKKYSPRRRGVKKSKCGRVQTSKKRSLRQKSVDKQTSKKVLNCKYGEFCLQSCDQFLLRKSFQSSQTQFTRESQKSSVCNIQQTDADADFQTVCNHSTTNDQQDAEVLNTSPPNKKRKFNYYEDYNHLLNMDSPTLSSDSFMPSKKKLIRIPLSNSGCVKSQLQTNKNINLQQAINIIKKVNKEVVENNKLKSNLRLYLTDGTIPLADDDDPGHRCVIDRMASALSKYRVFDSKRGESLSHFMMMESTGVATYTFFAPLAGISNLTAFHQETKKRRSFNLGANDFIVQPLMSVDNLNRLERVHGAIFNSHIRHQQLLPLEFYLEEDIPLVLYVRENDRCSSMVELPEQSSHAFITFGDVIQAETASRLTPSGLKVSCNDMDLMFEMDSMYFLERLSRILVVRGWDKGPLHNAADDWVTSDYLRLYPRTLREVSPAWDDHEKPWYEEIHSQESGEEGAGVQIEAQVDAQDTFVELIIVRTAEKLLDVVDIKIQGCSRYSGQLLSSSQAIKALSNLMICLRDMLRYAVSQNDLDYFYAASSCFPGTQDPHGVWFSKEYLLHLITVIQSKLQPQQTTQISNDANFGNGNLIIVDHNPAEAAQQNSVVTSLEDDSNSLVLQMSENDTGQNVDNEVVMDNHFEHNFCAQNRDENCDNQAALNDVDSIEQSELVEQRMYDVNKNTVVTQWVKLTQQLQLRQQQENNNSHVQLQLSSPHENQTSQNEVRQQVENTTSQLQLLQQHYNQTSQTDLPYQLENNTFQLQLPQQNEDNFSQLSYLYSPQEYENINVQLQLLQFWENNTSQMSQLQLEDNFRQGRKSSPSSVLLQSEIGVSNYSDEKNTQISQSVYTGGQAEKNSIPVDNFVVSTRGQQRQIQQQQQQVDQQNDQQHDYYYEQQQNNEIQWQQQCNNKQDDQLLQNNFQMQQMQQQIEQINFQLQNNQQQQQQQDFFSSQQQQQQQQQFNFTQQQSSVRQQQQQQQQQQQWQQQQQQSSVCQQLQQQQQQFDENQCQQQQQQSSNQIQQQKSSTCYQQLIQTQLQQSFEIQFQQQQQQLQQGQQLQQEEELQLISGLQNFQSFQQTVNENLRIEEENHSMLDAFVKGEQRAEDLQSLSELRNLWILSLQLEYKLAFQNDLMEWRKARSLRVQFEQRMDVLVMDLTKNVQF